MNKREFMLAAGAAGIAGAAWAAGPTGGAPAWQGRVGQVFRTLGHPVQLKLQRVDTRAAASPLHQFTLVFATDGGVLAAGTHVLHGDEGTGLALYLEPAGRDAAGHHLLRADCCHLA